MRNFNYSEIKNQKWDSDILGLIAAASLLTASNCTRLKSGL